MESFKLRRVMPDDLSTLINIDDEASKLYQSVGLNVALSHDHPFVIAESARWEKAIEKELAWLAVDSSDFPVGFVILDKVDGMPYLDQISVHPDNMRQGIGAQLLFKAIEWSGAESLWLTTYSQLNWNKPYYERFGFVQVSEDVCGPGIQKILRVQRCALPAPEKRIAMVRYASQPGH